jgi:hypothetical protein
MINAIHKRQEQMFEEFLYFNTETIFNFKHLLADNRFKIEIKYSGVFMEQCSVLLNVLR